MEKNRHEKGNILLFGAVKKDKQNKLTRTNKGAPLRSAPLFACCFRRYAFGMMSFEAWK
jgi:hypothetical protein